MYMGACIQPPIQLTWPSCLLTVWNDDFDVLAQFHWETREEVCYCPALHEIGRLGLHFVRSTMNSVRLGGSVTLYQKYYE